MDISPAPSLEHAVILIPAFNEGNIIATVIEEIRQVSELPILVIDDSSTDNTIVNAESAGAEVIPLPSQLGAWGATQTGIRYALRKGFELVITMDADGQHQARSISTLVEPVLRNEADVAIGACTQRGSNLRKVAWLMMKKTSDLALEDVTSGFRVYNRASLRRLASWRATLLDYQDIGVLLLLKSKGFTIVDVQVDMLPRLDGKSRVFHSWMMVIYYMCMTLLLGLSKRPIASSRRNTV